jgi:hypothetical protein
VVVRASDDLDPGPPEPLAAPDVVEGVIALFERQRSSGSGLFRPRSLFTPRSQTREPIVPRSKTVSC